MDKWGVKVDRVRKRKPDPARSKDMILIGLRSQKFSWRQIGKLMGTSHVAAYKRFHSIPEAVRAHYRRSVG